MDKKLHIVSFDIPLPANYGGVIDVFYKIKALHKAGVKIILHCFQYGDKQQADELLAYCQEVHYYKRLTGIQGFSLLRPYIVNSRKNSLLLKNLTQVDAPILFEGLHTCYYLNHPALKDRKKFVRAHNVEHAYYDGLVRGEKKWWKRLYFNIESNLLQRYEMVYTSAQSLFAISNFDEQYFQKFRKTVFLPPFHENDKIKAKLGKGSYCLFHGNLSVSENIDAALYLIKEVASYISYKFVIAGRDIPDIVREQAALVDNVVLVSSPDDEAMKQLMRDAHVHVLYTDVLAGAKLKLINSMYYGRFVLANPEILNVGSIHSIAEEGCEDDHYVERINYLFTQDCTQEYLDKRATLLEKEFSNDANAQKIIEEIFPTLP